MSEQRTEIDVTIHRSQAWLNEQRLQLGRNVPEDVVIKVCPADLSIEARSIILRGGGYENVTTLGYSQDYAVYPNYVRYGRADLIVDKHEPTPDDISAAIVAARAIIATEQAKAMVERAEREQRQLAEKAAEAEKAAKRTAARELLAEELAAKDLSLKLKAERIEDLEAEIAELQDAMPTDD